MKSKLELFIVVLFSTLSYSQFTSLDVTMDARSIAMGESFVANPNGLVAADNNPATLIGLKGLSLFYNRRKPSWKDISSNNILHSFGISLETSFGNFAILYKRFNDDLNNYPGPEHLSNPLPFYNYTVSISYAFNIMQNLALGINLKTHFYKSNFNNLYMKDAESNHPILADIGILYHSDGLINFPVFKDKISWGTSISNFGTDFKPERIVYAHQEQKSFISKLPRTFNIGFSYQLNIISFQQPDFLKFIFNGEFDYLLNNYDYENFPKIESYGYEDVRDIKRDTWKFGLEGSVMNLLFLRIGSIVYPFESFFSEKDKAGLSYGIGANFPFVLVGINYPVSISFDYAIIQTRVKNKSFDAFSISLNYNNPLF